MLEREMLKHIALTCGLFASACGEVKGTQVDAPIAIDAATEVDAPTSCPAGTTAICAGDQLVTCDAQGAVIDMTTCALGCHANEERCNKLAPSNGLAQALDEADLAPDLLLSGATTIDTDAGTIVDQSGTRTPPTSTLTTGLPVAVFVIKAANVTTQDIQVVGSRALAIVASGKITINGVVSVSARLDVNGPGGIATCRAGAGAAGNTNGKPGGGGGGYGSRGGNGGTGGVPVVQGGVGGDPVGTVELVPLRGGCPGGLSGGSMLDVDPVLPDPGGAGGALQLVSATEIAIAAGAFVAAHGGPGKSNTNNLLCLIDTPCGNGEGAGSGGGILLEAPVITVAATGGIVANGGGGSARVSGAGQPGQNSDVPAAGQLGLGDTGAGGNGAAGMIAAQNGGNGLNDDPVGGGGGGGVGRIRVNLPLGDTFSPAGVVSPTSSLGSLQVR